MRVLALLLTGCQPAPPAPATVTFTSVVPGVLIIPVHVKGASGWQELSMMLDTGAELSTLTTRGREALGLDVPPSEQPMQQLDTANGSISAPLIRFPAIRLAGMTHETTTGLLCADCPGGIDGLIGMNLLAAYDVQLDAAHDAVALTPHRDTSDQRDIEPWVGRRAHRKPLSNLPGVRVVVTNHSPWHLAHLRLQLACAPQANLTFDDLLPSEQRAIQITTPAQEPCTDLRLDTTAARWK
ncbi:MAG: hypothetical protein ACI8S6_005941 [Myxococcota bacterium]|jgi:hypothetical protein